MSDESMQKVLVERFKAPLREHYQRRIIFWRDEDKEFEADFDAIEIPNVIKVKRTGKNNFDLKKLLIHDDLTSNFLVYDPCSFENVHDDWLRDIVLYSEDYRADYTSMIMAELNMENSVIMRKTTKEYKTFFKSKARIKQLKDINREVYKQPEALKNDILLVAAGVPSGNFASVIGVLLKAGLDSKSNEVLNSIKKLGCFNDLREFLARSAAFTFGDDIDLEELAKHVLLSAFAQTTPESVLKGLEKYIPESGRAFCYSVVSAWRSKDEASLMDLCCDIENALTLYSRFNDLDKNAANLDILNCLHRSDTFPCIDEFIIKKLLHNEEFSNLNTKTITDTVECRRNSGWFSHYKDIYECIYYGAKFLEFMNNYQASASDTAPQKLWKNYIDSEYQIDTFYRCFRCAFDRAKKNNGDFAADEMERVAENIENIYQNRFLSEVNNTWTSAIASDMEKIGYISELPRQTDFWNNNVVDYIDKNEKAFVIISDALRYETAAELNMRLTERFGGEANLTAMQSIFPSITKFGMAALLPGKQISLDDKLDVLVDGLPTATTEQRQTILMDTAEKSAAITYNELSTMKREAIRKVTNGKNVVYIYHNAIDAIGDKAATEHDVFEACKKAIDEISSIVNTIVNTMQGSSVFITADHGFLYTARPLDELDKQSAKTTNAEFCELGRRYAISKIYEDAEKLIPVTLEGSIRDTDYKGWAPMGITRLKMAGGGDNYVHGGLSLQEMVVPLITYKHHRNSSKQRVEHSNAKLHLITSSRKITSMGFKLQFLQKEPVDGVVLASEYSICMVDDANKKVSETKTIVADRTDVSEKGRIIEIKLNLEPNTFDKNRIYRLVVTNGVDAPLEIDYHIDIAFAGDFGF